MTASWDALWTTRYGSAPEIVGSTLDLDEEPYTVVGVLPAGFEAPFDMARVLGGPAVLLALAATAAGRVDARGGAPTWKAGNRPVPLWSGWPPPCASGPGRKEFEPLPLSPLKYRS